jgi:hypothetical protein
MHACRPILFGGSADGVATSPFDDECIRDLPDVCVKSVVERAQVLLRHVHKSEARGLSQITIRAALHRLIGMRNRDMQLVVPGPSPPTPAIRPTGTSFRSRNNRFKR